MSVIFKPPGLSMMQSKAQAWINPVNCAGAMGKGLALTFKELFPENFMIYQLACKRKKLSPGHFIAVPTGKESPAHIVNLATKDHWRDPSRLEWVAHGAERVRIWAEGKGITCVACPALGSGLGGLEWSEVKCALVMAFEGSEVSFEVFEPQGNQPKLFRATKDNPLSKTTQPSEPVQSSGTTGPVEPVHDEKSRRIVFRKTIRP